LSKGANFAGIVSVWAGLDGRAAVWRRVDGALVREEERFRPWVLLDSTADLPRDVTVRELSGPGELRYLVSGEDGRQLQYCRDLGKAHALVLPAEEQFLVATGRTYFQGLRFDDLRRLQFDLETTGLDPERDRIFLIAVRDPAGAVEVLEGDEPHLIARLAERIRVTDPDVIENHNLHGFDLPFLECRARLLRVPLPLGRTGAGLRQRGWRRGSRFVAPGRECIDTLDAVLRYDFATRELPEHGLKAVARHLGIASADREYIPGERVYEVYRGDPERVRRYAAADVEEVAALARMLGGAAFALAQLAPRRYERLADAGAATGVIDPLLVRAYLRAGAALPAHRESDGTPHSGASLRLFAAGVARRVVKADVASLYPSLMRAHRIGPERDHLGAMLSLVDNLVERRLAAKAAARAAPPGSAERYQNEAMSAAMKLVVNSAYGYLAAGGSLTRFADVHAANEVTRHGRETLDLMCRELASRGVTLLEADTDGVYFSVPERWTEADERCAVDEVAALLPPLVRLEFEGRYGAMLSHEPKNYALLGYDGRMVFKGVAFRSSRAEPFGARLLRAATERLLAGDVPGVRAAYLETLDALRRRDVTTYDVSSFVRLTKTPEQYRAIREERRELAYEAMLASGRASWSVGDKARVYRMRSGVGAVVVEDADPRDYDVEHYVRVLRDTYAARFARAFTPEDYEAVFADPNQLSLFAKPLSEISTVLTPSAE
jgi:DNA polymerase elongation subunit (family B)